MAAKLKPEWVARLRQVDPQADLRFNHTVGRWEFILSSADGVMRSQFFGRFYVVQADGSRKYLPPDPETGLHPYRDLDDAAIEEVCANMERTFVANRYDGAGTPRKEILRRHRFNQAHKKRKYDDAGALWADMFIDRLDRIQGNPQVAVLIDLKPKPNPDAVVLDAAGQPTRRVA